MGMAFLFLLATVTPNVRALPVVEGPAVGMIQEEGEYVSDKVWDNWDWVNVGTELITSGGTVTFQLFNCGMKYAVACFFEWEVKPIEVYLDFIQTWRYETGLRAPEDFRMMTGMLLDKQVDIAWLGIKCAELSDREGWDAIYPRPFVIKDSTIDVSEIDGSPEYVTPPALPGASSSAFSPDRQMVSYLKAAFSLFGSGVVSSSNNELDIVPQAGAPITLAKVEEAYIDSLAFEKAVNKAAHAGALSHLKIPGGATFIDFRYSSYYGNKIHGPDGFFLSTDGKCHLLEMKMSTKGTLGRIPVAGLAGRTHIYQGSPEWLQKAMLRVSKESPEEFAKIMGSTAGHRLNDVLLGVDHIRKKMTTVVDEEMNIILRNKPEMAGNLEWIAKKKGQIMAELENFSNPDMLKRAYRSMFSPSQQAEYEEFIARVGGFWEEDFFFRVVNKEGKAPGRIKMVAKATGDFIKKMGGKAIKKDKIMYAGIKKVIAETVEVAEKVVVHAIE